MKKNESMEGLILLVISSFFIRESLKLHNQNEWFLSPALFPLMITIGGAFLSLILIYKGIKNREDMVVEKTSTKKVLLTMAICIVYLALLAKITFIPTTIVYLFLFLWILGERRWWVMGSISIITSLLIYYIFGNLLDVFLP